MRQSIIYLPLVLLISIITTMSAFAGGNKGGTPPPPPPPTAGIKWTLQPTITLPLTNPNPSLTAVVWNGSKLVSVNGIGQIFDSTNGGVTWNYKTQVSVPNQIALTNPALLSIAWSGTRFVAVGFGGCIYYSPDGVTWTYTQPVTPLTLNLNKVLWTGTQFVAVGESGNVVTSVDGITWTKQPTITYANVLVSLTNLTWTGNKLVGINGAGQVFESLNSGVSWTYLSTITDPAGFIPALKSIAWNGTKLVVVTGNGEIFDSTNGGSIWTYRAQVVLPNTITNPTLLSVTWSGSVSKFATVGFGGCIYYSADGITWTAVQPLSGFNLNDVIWTGTQFVAVGESGTVVTSQ
jgi:photosystem II stability/assembly factor-like uncharacterized protein